MNAEEYVRSAMEVCKNVLKSWGYRVSLVKTDITKSNEYVSFTVGRAYGAQIVKNTIRTAEVAIYYEDERPGHQPEARVYLHVSEFPLEYLNQSIERWKLSWWGRGMIDCRERVALLAHDMPAPEKITTLLDDALLMLRPREERSHLSAVIRTLASHAYFYYEPVMAEYLLKGFVWFDILGR